MGFIRKNNINCRVYKVNPYTNPFTNIKKGDYPYDEFYISIKDTDSPTPETLKRAIEIAQEFLDSSAIGDIELVGYSDDEEEYIKDWGGTILMVNRDEKEE